MMILKYRFQFIVAIFLLCFIVNFSSAQNIVFGPDPDPNFGPLNSFGVTEIFNAGIYAVDDQALEPDGNDMLRASTGVPGSGGDQFGLVSSSLQWGEWQ